MEKGTDTSPKKKRDEHGNGSCEQDHSVANNGVFSAAYRNGLDDASAAASRQQNPSAASYLPHHDHSHGAPPLPSHQTPPASSSPPHHGHGAKIMPSASSRSGASCRPIPYIAQTSDVHHHPDLPFLVTHWLSHFAPPSHSLSESKTSEETPNAPGILKTVRRDEAKEYEEALRKIRQAASNLASAFSTLGAFGHSNSSSVDTLPSSRPTTFSDLSRTYSPLLSAAFFPPHGNAAIGDVFNRNGNRRMALLDAVVKASSSAHVIYATNEVKCSMPWSLLEAAREGSVPTEGLPNGNVSETTRTGSGRIVGNSLSVDPETAMGSLVPPAEISGSAMQKPVLLGANGIGVAVDVGASSMRAAQASRRKISLRIEAALQRKEMECTMQTLKSARNKVEADEGTSSPAARRRAALLVCLMEQADVNSDLDLRRIAAQLERRMHELERNHVCTKAKVAEAETEAEKSYRDLAAIRMQHQSSYRLKGEPAAIQQILRAKSVQKNLGFGPSSHTPGKSSIVLAAILNREYQGRHLSFAHSQTNLSVLKSRLSHAVTISCHLVYPVYCLKFDRTGKYFITGADDQLAKLFYLGAGHKNTCPSPHDGVDCGTDSRPPAFNYGANGRGAVLVCVLRGHAGVVTDIDVNVDNALLATASGDGDVRVWGLKDGCPVAILRGHKDGANMVSWSSLTPFRLVTCGEDGLARMWDVSKAALKRYGDFINNWSHYKWRDHEGDRASQPHPPSYEERHEDDSSTTNNFAEIGFGVNRDIGDFVANDSIDKGVTLLAQLQHGAIIEETRLQGRVTRTVRKPVKVMCIARCAIGGHFCTGSDDGLGHVWADDDDRHVAILDHELSDFDTEDGMVTHTTNSISPRRKMKLKPSNAPSQERLLATLRGHCNAVTDMKYSNAGDRILTASMKDGVACVWSWGKEGRMVSVGKIVNKSMSGFYPGTAGSMHAKFSNITQLSIQLTNVSWGGSSNALSARQKATPANCDGVTWTCDDTKIITSQSTPRQDGSTDIIPGSQMIYIWDSHSGKCLMGIMSSHSSLCSTLAPHPTLPSVVASAGSDGVVNVWDLDRGDCFCTHTNTLMHGPAEPATDRGKQIGYLDVQFSPDGLNLLLTDENGRVTILDTLVPARLRTGMDNSVIERYSMPSWILSTESWMGEQYFANDYYDLVYDTNGYCIERGSELPPHLAPKGVRCTHEGISHPEIIRESYRKLEGPLPLPESSVRWYRDDIRAHSSDIRSEVDVTSGIEQKKAKKIVRNTEIYQGRESIAIITLGGKLVQPERQDLFCTNSSFRVPGIPGNRNTGRQLSSRYRWVGFGDLPESEDDNEEQNDEDYEGNRRTSLSRNLGESSPDLESQTRRRRGRLRRNGRRESSATAEEPQEHHQPSRASSRQTANQRYHEINSDDEHLNEMMSTHTKPSGNFKEDWLVSQHSFKMPRGEGSIVRRNWLIRSSHQGNCLERKFYCPQVGDSVVYIPRAHYDTMKKFPVPSVLMPWKSWPTHSSWPVVRCKVTHIRYRFPYKMYYKSRCKDEKLQGVAAILSLEISGVPSQWSDRNFPWPAPNFISLSKDPIKFEVTVFECYEEAFIIPECLYSWRIKELERAVVANDGKVDGISVTVHCPPDLYDCYYTEDAAYVGYTGHLVRINDRREDEIHFVDSGYNALSMKWDMGDNSDMDEIAVFCVWNISVNNPSCDIPAVSTMGEGIKKAVKSAFRAVMNLDTKVAEWFYDMIDTSQYTDFLEMVEVPMYLSLIKKRLRSNYYTNKSSVVADMELVKENCYKYNEDGNEYYELACRMYDKFKDVLDLLEEPQDTSFEEKSQIIHRGRCTPAFVSSNYLELGQEQPPLLFASDVQQQHFGGGISSVRKVAALECVPGTTEPCSQTDNDKLDTEDGKNEYHNEEEFETKVASSCKSSVEVQVEENAASRRTLLSEQQLHIGETGDTSRRFNLRKGRKPSYAEKDSEDDENDKSDSEGSTDKDIANAKPFAPNSKSKKFDTNTRDDENKILSCRKPSSEVRCAENAAHRQTRRSARQLQARKPGGVRQGINSRSRRKPETSADEDVHRQEEELHTKVQSRRMPISNIGNAEDVAQRRTRQSAQQLQAAEAGGHMRRMNLRLRSKPNYVEKDSEEEESLESSGREENGDVSTDEDTANAESSSQTGSSDEADAETSDDEDERHHEDESQSRAKVQPRHKPKRNNVAQRLSQRLAEQSEATKVRGLSGRMLRARTKSSYAEKDSDEEEYLESSGEGKNKESDSDNDVLHRKRKLRHTNDHAARKKRGRPTKQKKSVHNFPKLERWPQVLRRKIPQLGLAVLNKMKDSDDRNLFSRPVCEEHPELAEDYLRKVENPMDFHKIENERLGTYRHIAELQDDLILIFRNCCVFNGVRHEYSSYALGIWKSLNDVFDEACAEEKISTSVKSKYF